MTVKFIVASMLFITLGFQCVLGLFEIYVEATDRRENKKRHYDFRETLSNLCAYNLNIFKWILVVPIFVFYNYLFSFSEAWHFGWPKSEAINWLIAFVLADFIFYGYHVLSHRWNLLWGTHLVHHQPEYFNLSIGGRTGIFERPILFVMALPLALTGLSPVIYFSAAFLGYAFMGWTHTRLIGRLSILEYVLNTPTHHKIHHYRDISRFGGTKNFGGVFIIWDRIFGTLWEEEKTGDYELGISGTPQISSPFKAQIFFYRHLFKLFFKVPIKDRLKLLFSHYLPEPIPSGTSESLGSPRSFGFYEWFLCFLLLLLTYQSTSTLTLGLTLRLVEEGPDAALLTRLAVACGATLLGIFQISKILYDREEVSAWARLPLLLALTVASFAFVFLSQQTTHDYKSVIDFALGSRVYLALGALITLR